MFKGLFGKRSTTKSDVVLSVAGAVIAVWKAFDTYKEYQAEKVEINEENEK